MASVLSPTPPLTPPDRASLDVTVVRTLRRIHRRATHARALVATDAAAAVDATFGIGELVVACLADVRRLIDELARSGPARQALTDEIHDSLGHSLSLAAVLAGVARATIARHPQRAADALDQIVDVTADAADELVAGLQRPGAAPSTVDLRALTRQIRSVPEPPVVRIEEQALAIAPEPVVACAGKIVRESLTNARRHAPGAPTGVGISVRGTELVVVVTNAPAGAPCSAGSRRGIAGMRRRAHAVGGRLNAAATPAGGFQVQAHLPLHTVS